MKNILVKDIMLKFGEFPTVSEDELFRESIEEMNKFGLGIACIVDSQRKLKGVLTDGDIRRLILRVQKPLAAIFVDEAYSYSTIKFTEMDEYTLLSDANGDTWLNSQNNGSVWLTNDGSQTALYCTAGWVHIPNGIEGNLWCNGAVRIVGRLNIGRNDPGGGSGDQSFLEYVVVSGSDKEQTVLRIVCGNDANDNINLRPSGKVGIKTDQPSYTLHVNGDCGATQFYATSDYRLKNDVETLKDEKYNIDSLRPVSYTLKETQKPALGFIAHEVQEHFPEMVSGEKDGDEMMQAIEYNQMIPLLVKEIQELKARVKELESKQN